MTSHSPFKRFMAVLAVVINILVLPGTAYATLGHDLRSVVNNTVWLDFYAAECGAAAGGATTGGGGSTGGGATNSENAKQVWDALASHGLPPFIIAGIMGNIQAESHFDPTIIQNGGHSNNPADAGSGGWGLVQWTPGAKVIPFLKGGPTIPSEIDALWFQLTQGGGADQAGGDRTFAATSLEAAARAFMTGYERPKDQSETAQKHRVDLAREVMKLYGNGAPETGPPFKADPAAGVGGGAAAPGASGAGCAPGSAAGATIVGDKAFPLTITKAAVDQKNPGMFANGTTSKSGHPYTAYDILADTGTPVVAFLSGEVKEVSNDRCGGTYISIYNKESDLSITYMHMNTDPSSHVKGGDPITLGQKVGLVGSLANGCVVPHLHIDAAKGQSRPGCSRLSCPQSNAVQFVDIGPQLFETHEKLP